MVKRMMLVARLALLMTFSALSIVDAQEKSLPETPQGKIVAAYMSAFNSGDENAMREFFLTNVPKEALQQRPVEGRLQRYRQMHGEMGSLELQKVIAASEQAVTIVARTKNGDRLTFNFEFDSKQSDKLAGIRIEMGEQEPGESGPPGVVLAARNGKPFFKQAYGYAEKRHHVPNRIDTKFNLGSINKYFTRLAIGQLAEQGKLSFDDTLIKLLPDYPNRAVAEKITVQQLLEMSSGLGDFFGERFENTPKDKIRTLNDYLQFFVNDSLLFEPGTQRRYSNAGYIVLGLIVEKTSGENYYSYVKDHIFTPAGMKNTDWYEMNAVVPNIATGYERVEGNESTWISNIYTAPQRGSSAGGGYSTAEDLLKFAVALQEGKLFSPRYSTWMLTGNLPNESVGKIDRSGGIGIAGGAPGINAAFEHEVKSGFTTIVLSNYTPPSAEQVAKKIRSWLKRIE
ncbi:MAG: beta-lactamase family protein [Ignavibacteriae bacterium]|nr:beta-lactamase family protein [Ignavibacteriota bacterium]